MGAYEDAYRGTSLRLPSCSRNLCPDCCGVAMLWMQDKSKKKKKEKDRDKAKKHKVSPACTHSVLAFRSNSLRP